MRQKIIICARPANLLSYSFFFKQLRNEVQSFRNLKTSSYEYNSNNYNFFEYKFVLYRIHNNFINLKSR